MNKNVSVALCLSVGLGLLYWPALFAGGVFFQRDIYNYWRPHIDWALNSLAHGEAIGWNPGMQFGMPFLADPNFQILYPPTWLLLILSPDRYYTILVVGHALLAGFGLAKLLESYGLEKGACAGALAMAMSGPFVSMANLWHHYCGAAWIPFVVWSVRRLGQTQGAAWRGFACLLAIQALAGSAESLVMSAILGGLTQWPLFRVPRPVGRLLFAAVLGCCIAAIQWMPTARLFASSARKDFGIQAKLGWSLPPRLVDQFIVAGDPRTREILFNNTAESFSDSEVPLIAGPYLGAFGLVLAVIGAARLPGFLLVGLAALIGSFGRFLPAPLPALLTLFPFRYPTKALILVSVTFAMLVGAGAHAVLSRPPSPSPPVPLTRRVAGALVLLSFLVGGAIVLPGDPTTRLFRSGVFAAGGLLAATALPGPGWLLAAGVLVDGWSGLRWVNEYADPTFYAFRPPVVDVVRQLTPHPRVFVAYSGEVWAQADLNGRGLKSGTAFQASLGEILFPPHGLRFGIRHGYQPEFTGLGVAEMQALEKFLETRFRGDIRRYLDLGAIDAVISTDNTNPLGEAIPLARFESITSSPTRVDVWGKTPRAGLARRALTTSSLDRSMAMIAASDFKPGVDTVLQDPSGREGLEERFAGGAATIKVDRNDRVDIEVVSDGPGVLTLRDGLRDGWSATVNGEPTPIFRADVILRAVRVPSGTSVVSFRYTSPGLIPGTLLCAMALVVLVASRAGIKVRP